MKNEPDKTYEISSEYWDKPFRVTVRKGKVIWCSDQSHPAGTDWKALRDHYEHKIYECQVKEVKE